MLAVVDRISARRLKGLLDRVEGGGEVLVVDLRERDEFEGGHVPGAVRMTPEDALRRAGELAECEAVVVYDADPVSAVSTRTAQALRDRGVPRAVDFEGGLAEWMARGFDVEQGPGTSRAQ